ncbi:nucleotidyltransferase domain-containing protein [Candidatus Methylomirabilis sp.]|uniref:Nucleotidyltransferase domain-containing protein n=1 Tax=Candidatus Methylomirabilis tolerans TaxID=3123416 RepID=A0AAJ1AI10_9BACT|nr:nucleotidyltransferase domain-containing protein [Candidatus Methylomirabilis sp.]
MTLAEATATIIHTVLAHYPATQAIYLFGSYGAGDAWPDSDADIALLFTPEQAKAEHNLLLSQCRFDLEDALPKEVDLLNARQVSTVFQKEIIGGVRIYCADPYAADEFEMLVISYYQKLNEERREILDAFDKTGRAYAV